MNKIANYDTLDYDYRTYWKHRKYEDEAEHILLKKSITQNGNWFLDIGGSYGRLTETYYKYYKNPIIIDYSLKTLQKNSEYLHSKYPDLILIAANAYFLPFKDNVFDGALMVRVLHHINEPLKYFKELYRVLKNNSLYIQEFANKIHLKAAIRALIHMDFSIFSQEPLQQPDRDNNEGATKHSNVPFLNYHPTWLKQQFLQNGFNVEKKYGCSFLRIPALKKLLGDNTLIKLEKSLQKTLSWTNIPPSIFFKTRVEKVDSSLDYKTLEDILACPWCKGKLDISKEKAHCVKCEKVFKKEQDIWDFRI